MTSWPPAINLTSEEFGKLDIVDRLLQTVGFIVNEVGPDHFDPIVYQLGGIGFHVSDMLHDAIIEIKRLRAEVTTAAIEAARHGDLKGPFKTIEELFVDLNKDD